MCDKYTGPTHDLFSVTFLFVTLYNKFSTLPSVEQCTGKKKKKKKSKIGTVKLCQMATENNRK